MQILDLRAESSGGFQSEAVVDRLKESLSLPLPKHGEGWGSNSLKPIGDCNKMKSYKKPRKKPKPEFFMRERNDGDYEPKGKHNDLQK
ncbi:hypothetical protein WN943_001449 [Citrus x changshan-huyou]